MMKVLISGGSGFIGSHLVASLARDGHVVVVLSRRPTTKDPPQGVRYVTWDARGANGDWRKYRQTGDQEVPPANPHGRR